MIVSDYQLVVNKTKNKIGIMGGRLSSRIDNEIQSFPRYSWKDEFEKAKICGFDVIEWIFDLYEKNPILSDDGIKEIKKLSEKTNVVINSVCADYFMKHKLFSESQYDIEKARNILQNLIHKCGDLEIKILEIPLVDSSSLRNNDEKEQLISNLEKVLPIAEKNNVSLTLETDLPPKSFKELLLTFDHPNIKANYDIGNSAALGYNSIEELGEFGKWIVNIHVKDRKFHGSSVPLGTGDADFDSFFSTLATLPYVGDLIIQGAREDDKKIAPEYTCKKYLSFTKQYVDMYL